MEVHIPDKESFELEAARFAERLKRSTSGARVVGLSGELGAGKTTFVQTVARVLGAKENITSPTFVLRKDYPLPHHSFRALIHIDAYRLEGEEELPTIRFSELLEDPTALVMVEWAERIASAMPEDMIKVSIRVEDDDTRTIHYG